MGSGGRRIACALSIVGCVLVAASCASPVDDHIGGGGNAATSSTTAGNCTADLQTDAKNCGACGHDCLAGACSAGVCQPFVLTTEPTAGMYDIAVKDKWFAWSSLYGAAWKPLFGVKPAESLTDGIAYEVFFVGSSVFTVSRMTSEQGVHRAALTDTMGSYFLTSTSAVIQGSDGASYFAMYRTFPPGGDAALVRIDEDVITPLASGPQLGLFDDYGTLAINSTQMFYTAGGILAMPKDASAAPVEILSATALGSTTIRRLHADDERLYWFAYGAGTFDLMSAPVTGGTPVKLLSGNTVTTNMALGEKFVYVTVTLPDMGGSTVVRVPKAGGAPEVVAESPLYILAVATENGAYYYAVHDDVNYTATVYGVAE